jgi:hypothetical protein
VNNLVLKNVVIRNFRQIQYSSEYLLFGIRNNTHGNSIGVRTNIRVWNMKLGIFLGLPKKITKVGCSMKFYNRKLFYSVGSSG